MAITDSAPLFAMGCALVGILAGILLAGWVMRQPQGNERMRTIAGAIQEGASAYLNRQYRAIAIVAVVITLVLLLYKINQGSEVWQYPLAFLVGAVFSAAAGYIGMNVAVRSNMRTAQGAVGGLNRALQIAFRGGSVTGLLVVSLGLLGVSGMFILSKRPEVLVPLGFGGSLISVFARLGGGISILATIVGIFFVRVRPSGGIMAALYKGTVITGALAALIFAYPIFMLMKGITAIPTAASSQKLAGGLLSNSVSPGGLFAAA